MPLLKPTNYVTEHRPEDVTLLHNKVAARMVREPAYRGRFFIPKEARQETNIAKVVALGIRYEGPLKVGDYIIFASWVGREWPHSVDEDVILLDPDNIVAQVVLEDD